MVKRSESSKAVRTPHGTELEQKIVYDDALIPSADEIAKYQSTHPDFAEWFMDTGKAEQRARHKSYEERYSVIEKSVNTDRLLLIFLFVLIIAFLIASAILVWHDKHLEGSVFGVTSIGIVIYLISQRERKR